MEQLANYAHYTTLMRRGFYDKLFFVDKLFEPWETFMDYGCADGFQTKMIGKIFRDKRIIGWDEDPKMVDIARYTGEALENVSFTQQYQPTDVLYLSSVVHEVYAYKTEEEVQAFWDKVFTSTGKYIIIRDMFWNDVHMLLNSGLPLEMLVRDYCKRHQISGELQRFEQIYGDIRMTKSMIHWLLKYPYVSSPNWERELKEDYLKLSIQMFKKLVPDNWEIVYLDNNSLPYLQNKWEQDLGMNLPFKTHSKLILKRKK